MATEEDTKLELEESPVSSPVPVDEKQQCPICSEKLNQPKILTCLHVFCEACLEKLPETPEPVNGILQPLRLKCTVCEQFTTVPSKGVQDLQTEHVLSDMLELSGAENSGAKIICTSCKAKEEAVARCNDCANFLCPNCVTAHKFMRCFENHKVVTLDELPDQIQSSDGASVHQPIFCSVHFSESLKYFCHTCETAICAECIIIDHKKPDHNFDKIEDVDELLRKELKSLSKECQSKVETCTVASTKAESALSDLQSQQEDAKSLIEETFQSYKAMLEKKKTDLLEELDKIHSQHELELMGLCHSVYNMMNKVEDSCQFTEHVLNNGNSIQIAVLKRIITTQLLALINNSPNVEPNLSIEFKTDADRFEKMLNVTFGTFDKEDSKNDACRMVSPFHSSFENEGLLPHAGPDVDASMMANAGFYMDPFSSAPPVSFSHNLPPSQLAGNLQSLSSLSSVIASIPAAMKKGTNYYPMQDPNLSRGSQSPAMSDSGISVGDGGSTNSNNSATMFNIAAMANMRQMSAAAAAGNMIAGVTGRCPSSTSPKSLSDSGSRTQTPLSHHEVSPTSMGPMPPMVTMPTMGTMSQMSPQSAQNRTMENLVNLLNQNQIVSTGTKVVGSRPPGLTQPPGGTIDNAIITGGATEGGLSSSMNTPSSSITFNFPTKRWALDQMSSMQIRCKFGQLGPGKGQFNSPHGFCLGVEEDIVVADTNNHRIQVFDKMGDFKNQFGIPGREEGQLWYPRKVAVMKSSGKYVVCDRGNERSRMQIFTRNGHFVKKIAIRYIDIVAGLAITAAGNIAAVDSVSPTVFCISEQGDLLKWFDCSDYMREPSDIAVCGDEYFVCDFKGHCVVVFNENGQFMRRIGCENITNYPNGIDISDAGDVLIGDSHGNRFHVGVFQRDGSLIGEFQCPYVKVSRCCGLKITSEGYVVTLAKNNHHVLVLNTLYIT